MMSSSTTKQSLQTNCPLCGGVGFVIYDLPRDHPMAGRAQPCQCRQEALREQQQQQLVKMSHIGHLARLTFDSFLPEGMGLNADQSRSLLRTYELCLDFAQNPKGWVFLVGGYGCGKTHLAAAIANRCLQNGQQVLFVNTPDLLDHLRGAFRPNSEVGYETRFEQVRTAPILILDDFGAQQQSEWAQEKLYQLFNYRYVSRLPTVITSNADLEQCEPRIRSRLSDDSLVKQCGINAPDFRRNGAYEEDGGFSALAYHKDKLFSNFILRDQELPASELHSLRYAVETLRHFAQAPKGAVLLHSKEYGNGKTHLAAAVANYAFDERKRVLFVSVPDLLDYLRNTFSPNSQITLDKRFQEIKEVELLILDDLGTESATPFAREKLYQLFNYRFMRHKPMVVTSTTAWEEFDPRLLNRFEAAPSATIIELEVRPFRAKRGGAESAMKRASSGPNGYGKKRG